MFGYIIFNKPELKFREYDVYRSYYCGFCEALKNRHGRGGQLTLSYDLTFLIMLLSSLYDTQDEVTESRCVVHPIQKHQVRLNKFSEYASDMNVILAYYKALDDWSDERKVTSVFFAKMLQKSDHKVAEKYPDKTNLIFDMLEKIHNCEKMNITDIDKVSGYFGNIMAEIFCYQEDNWAGNLRQIGFFLGKFIYIMDAYDDIEKDIKEGNYNPLKDKYYDAGTDFDEYCHQILTMMMSECSKAFERLPIVDNVEILRNILYSGVWVRADNIKAQRNTKKGN